MELTKAQNELVKIKLRILNGTKCPICASSKRHVGDHIFDVHNRAETDAVPVIAVFCDECGRVDFFSAVFLGLVEQDDY